MNHYRISSEKMWHEINAEFGESGGVYILKCYKNSESNAALPIDRLLASDEEGCLYIGKATSFIKRVADLKKSISPKYISGSHECGSRYKINKNIRAIFPYENLFVELVGSKNPRETETEILKKYETTYGELPPFNRCS